MQNVKNNRIQRNKKERFSDVKSNSVVVIACYHPVLLIHPLAMFFAWIFICLLRTNIYGIFFGRSFMAVRAIAKGHAKVMIRVVYFVSLEEYNNWATVTNLQYILLGVRKLL